MTNSDRETGDRNFPGEREIKTLQYLEKESFLLFVYKACAIRREREREHVDGESFQDSIKKKRLSSTSS